MLYFGIFLGILLGIVISQIRLHILFLKLNKKRTINYPANISIELAPCPHCGMNCQTLAEIELDGKKYYAMRCNSAEGGCGCQTGLYEKSGDAVLAWNSRIGR